MYARYRKTRNYAVAVFIQSDDEGRENCVSSGVFIQSDDEDRENCSATVVFIQSDDEGSATAFAKLFCTEKMIPSRSAFLSTSDGGSRSRQLSRLMFLACLVLFCASGVDPATTHGSSSAPEEDPCVVAGSTTPLIMREEQQVAISPAAEILPIVHEGDQLRRITREERPTSDKRREDESSTPGAPVGHDITSTLLEHEQNSRSDTLLQERRSDTLLGHEQSSQEEDQARPSEETKPEDFDPEDPVSLVQSMAHAVTSVGVGHFFSERLISKNRKKTS